LPAPMNKVFGRILVLQHALQIFWDGFRYKISMSLENMTTQ